MKGLLGEKMNGKETLAKLECFYLKNGWLYVRNKVIENDLAKYRIDLEAYNPANGRTYFYVYDKGTEKLNLEILYSFGLFLTKEYKIKNYTGYIVRNNGTIEPVLICNNERIKEIKEKKEYASKQGLEVVLEFLLKKIS